MKPNPSRLLEVALLSFSYVSSEEKIEDISRKLDRICSLMNSVGISPSSAQPQIVTQVTPGPSSGGLSPAASRVQTGDDSESELEGELSLTAHAVFATDFVEQAVSKNQTIPVTPEMTSSLNALRKIIDTNSSSRHSSNSPNSPPKHVVTNEVRGGLTMPPLHSAFTCLGILKGRSSSSHNPLYIYFADCLQKENVKVRYMWTYEIDSVGQFMEYFLTVYSGKPSNADLIIVNAGLYRLFHECSAVETDPALKADYKAQSALCHQNLEPLLTRLPFILPCTLDYIMALSMGVYLPISKAFFFQRGNRELIQCSRNTTWTRGSPPWPGA